MVSGMVVRLPPPSVILLSLGLVALGACQSTPGPADATAPAKPAAAEKVDEAAKPGKKQEVVVEPEKKEEKARATGFRWPWQKKPGKEGAAPEGDKVAKPEEKQEAAVEPQNKEEGKKAGATGFRWPWQKKKPAVAEPEVKPDQPRDEGPPPTPAPDPGQIAPRAPEPGLVPVDSPAPREPKPDDPLSGIGLHPGT